jgi:NADH-dependent formate dehydrogenase delta subunit FdsD
MPRLITMANQIAANLGGNEDLDDVADALWRHVSLFWTPDMCQRLLSSTDTSPDEPLPPVARLIE